jgi:hypothetical protein
VISQDPKHLTLFNAIRSEHDLAFFTQLVLGFDLSPLSIRILRSFGPQLNTENQRVAAASPRGAGMTTNTVMLVLHELIFKEKSKIVVMMPNIHFVGNFIQQLRELAAKAARVLNIESVTFESIMRSYTERVHLPINPEYVRGMRPDLTLVADSDHFKDLTLVAMNVGPLSGRLIFTFSQNSSLMDARFFDGFSKVVPDESK